MPDAVADPFDRGGIVGNRHVFVRKVNEPVTGHRTVIYLDDDALGPRHDGLEVYDVIGRRSEERRVGKEGKSRWSPYHEKKKKGETYHRRRVVYPLTQ